jgi:hypothetical protein
MVAFRIRFSIEPYYKGKRGYNANLIFLADLTLTLSSLEERELFVFMQSTSPFSFAKEKGRG